MSPSLLEALRLRMPQEDLSLFGAATVAVAVVMVMVVVAMVMVVMVVAGMVEWMALVKVVAGMVARAAMVVVAVVRRTAIRFRTSKPYYPGH